MPNVQCFRDLERFEIVRSTRSVTSGDRNVTARPTESEA